MRILVTGASGFVGRHLLSRFSAPPASEQLALTAVSRRVPSIPAPPVRWTAADLSVSGWTAALPDEDFDAVVHLAQSRHHREFPAHAVDIFTVNVRSTFELAEWAVRHRVQRFVFASTGNVYRTGNGVHHEEDCCEPDTMYGVSKFSAELLLKPFSSLMHVLVLRLFGVYGPGQADAMLPGVIQRFLAGEEIVLAGNLGVEFNPIYVDDCSTAIAQLLAAPVQPGYQVLNVGGLETVDLGQVAQLLETLTRKKARIRVTADAPRHLVGSIDRLRSAIAFLPATSFAEGLSRALAFQASS